ncbi:hypothetical protein GCM10022243_09440 [Saccharothrix violaceirubra]|uniref:Secreted protein n=1 Tax=Saccharothrix violaceirubra TaxID=413306 RepID=A0A7W7T450_9PSEU|nr:hypothetical protein [Saccharothrix violaceirubra]MBB4966218.1 hypothetical protein [Saccharothrix violaceirubra]
MFIRLVLGVVVALVVVASPAAAHVVDPGADLQVAQSFAGVETTLVIRRTAEAPGPLRVDVVAYQPVRDVTVELAVGGRSAAVRLVADRAGAYPAVLAVAGEGPHELRVRVADEVAVVPFDVEVPRPDTWEVLVYGGFGAVGLALAVALVSAARARRVAAAASGGVAGVVLVVVATVAVLSPEPGDRPRAPGRPSVQAFVAVDPVRPVVGREFTVRFDLVDGATGLPVDDLAVHHAASGHLVVTSLDGGFFRHLHPLRTDSGRLEVRLAADRGGRYTAYLEVERDGAGQQLVSGTFDVDGPPGPDIVAAGRTYPVGRPVAVEVDTGRTGLQAWLGMAGHLIVRDRDGRFLGHAHERDMSSTSDGTVGGHGPLLRFTVNFPRVGRYYAWVQYVADFRIVTISYLIDVR